MIHSDFELSQNKLIILYMLDISSNPLRNTHITDFILEKGYTNYFALQEYLHQLYDTDLIKLKKLGNNSVYELTKIGKETLDLFTSRIPNSTMNDIKEYLKKHSIAIKSSVEIFSNYIPGLKDDYLVECFVKDGNILLMELKMTVFDKSSAIAMCEKWQTNSAELYQTFLYKMLEE